ncbi:MAG: ABC transporter ATP-binding protein [Bacteriovoracaceae bacterium]
MSKNYILEDEQESDSKLRKESDFKSFIKIIKEARFFWKGYAFSFALIGIAIFFIFTSARLIGEFVEFGLMAKDKDLAIRLASMIIGCELISVLFQWAGRRSLSISASKTVLRIREILFAYLQNLPMKFYDRQPQGRIVTRVTHDMEGMDQFFISTLGRLLSGGFMATSAIIAMCLSDLKLGLILTSSIIPAGFFIYLTRNRVRDVNRKMQKMSSATNSKLAEFINGIEVIRVFGLENWSRDQYSNVVDENREAHLEANSYYAWTRPLLSFLCQLPLVGLVYFGGKEVIAGTMSVGLFVAFIRYCERFVGPIMMLAREFNVIQQAMTGAERVASFLAHDEENVVLGENGQKLIDENFKGEVQFKNVQMSYDESKKVLKDVSFNIKAGEKVGLVGRTGCGKSTTVSLLSRLYEFQEGDISIDGVSIRDFDRDSLRSNIGFISQDVVIIKGSLRENLAFGHGLKDEQLLSACGETGLLKVMESSKLTLDSHIVEGGENLSVGQRQLLALTRIFINDPKILIMDEATANIDEHHEEIIQKAVQKLMSNRTSLTIAHRLKTLKNCDRILVFQEGEIVEKGSEEELMSQKGLFFNLQKNSEGLQEIQ